MKRIFGPHVVDKMTVGQALASQTGLKLLHHHRTVEPVRDLFEHMLREHAADRVIPIGYEIATKGIQKSGG